MIEIRVPAKMAYREVATRSAAAACKVARAERLGRGDETADIDAAFVDQVVSAVGEAFNNAVDHAYRDRPPGDVTIRIKPEADRLEVQVLDDGASFDLESVPVPDLSSLPESGMGLFIIRSFVDVVSYRPGSPNRLVMIKYFDSDKAPSDLCPIDEPDPKGA